MIIADYNTTMYEITFQLSLCGEPIDNVHVIGRTLSTFHVANNCIDSTILKHALGSIHGWVTFFWTKDLRIMSHWILAFIMIYYCLINQF